MSENRRHFLVLAGAGSLSWAMAGHAKAASRPVSAFGLDAANFGLRAGSADDQSVALQRGIDEAARLSVPLAIAPGLYRVGGVRLASGAQLSGIRGATRFVFTDGPSLIAAGNAERVTLSGLVFDGMQRRLPEDRGLVHCENVRGLRIENCEIANAGGDGVHCIGVDGELTDTLFRNAADAAIHSLDARGLLIARNTVTGAGNNGIQIWRSAKGDDGTIVTDNRVENIANRSGGSGQYGNAINVFRADNVIVRGNRIKNCAFSAVRGNGASNIRIDGNTISDAREVALYAEFGFEGALISGNSVDGAAIGISVTNFNQGGRLAVIQGNLIRNLLPKRPAGTDPYDQAGIGISAEADAAISGNVVENAPFAAMVLGFGNYQRDIAATGNVLRHADIGIAVSVANGAGTALIAGNVIAGAVHGAVVGMDRLRVVTGDLTKGGAERYPNLSISGNRAD